MSKKGKILIIFTFGMKYSIIRCLDTFIWRREFLTSCFISGSYARPFNWPVQTAFPTMQPVRQDRRVSMGVSGDLYFSNVLFNDSAVDYCCNARFPYKNVIQQKMPVVVKVHTSEYKCIHNSLCSTSSYLLPEALQFKGSAQSLSSSFDFTFFL